jgi:hypothetical protein
MNLFLAMPMKDFPIWKNRNEFKDFFPKWHWTKVLNSTRAHIFFQALPDLEHIFSADFLQRMLMFENNPEMK